MIFGREKARREPDNQSRREFLKTGAVAVAAVAGINSLGGKMQAAQVGGLIENKFINKDGKCEYIFTSSNPKEAHDSANQFQDEVGKALRAAYPSRILEPNVILQILKRGGQKLYRLIWSCKIVSSSEAEAN